MESLQAAEEYWGSTPPPPPSTEMVEIILQPAGADEVIFEVPLALERIQDESAPGKAASLKLQAR